MRQVVDHVVQRGYKRPCYVSGSTGATQADRLEALTVALAARRRRAPLVFRASSWTSDALSEVVDRIVAMRADVAICYDDKTALHLMDLVGLDNVGVNPDLGNIYWHYEFPEETSEAAIVSVNERRGGISRSRKRPITSP